MPDINNQGSNIGNQFIGSTFNGAVTIKGDTVIYEQDKKLPRRLTAIPTLQTNLIGRAKDLQELTDCLTKEQTVALVRGMGGVGKTTLATAYIRQELPNLIHAIWVQQTTDFATSLLSTDNLPATLGIPITDSPTADAQSLLRELSILGGPSLLVIDNAESDINQFINYLPGAPNWKVLITGRKKLRVITNLQLDNLEENDAIALFQEHYQIEENDSIIRTIVADIGCHALTIELLAKTAQKLHLPLQKFYQILSKRGLAIGRRANISLAHAGTEDVERVFPYLLAVFEMSGLSKDAQRLLFQFTIFPTEFISLDRLTEVFQINLDQENKWDNFNHQLTILTDAGWLTHNPNQGYRIHQVVQDVVRESLKAVFTPEDLNQSIIGTIELIDFDISIDNPALMLDELSFGKSVINNLTEFPKSDVLFLILIRISSLSSIFGYYQQAIRYLEKGLKISLELYGEAHYNVQNIRSDLALNYSRIGKHLDAVSLLEKAVFYDTKTYGDAHIKVYTKKMNLAGIYFQLAKYDEATEILEFVLKGYVIHYGETSANTQICRSSLAAVYGELGRYNEAIGMAEIALKYDIENLGEDHPSVQTRKSNLATLYLNINEPKRAFDLLVSALRQEVLLFGKDHPVVQDTRNNLANVLLKVGKYNEAGGLLKESLNASIKRFGEEHPSVQNTRSTLALVCSHFKMYDAAIELNQKSLHFGLQHFGEEHPVVQTRRMNLAIQFYYKSDFAQALPLVSTAYTHRLARFGPDNSEVKETARFLDMIRKGLESG